MKNAVKLHDTDNVTVVIEAVKQGEDICYADRQGCLHTLKALQDIPIYHKAASIPIHKGEVVLKYGERIGIAACDICIGEHVHVHNVRGASLTKGDPL